MRKLHPVLLVLPVVAAAAASQARASDLYGVDFTNGIDRLYSVDQSTGALTAIGATGSGRDGDLTSTDTILYGSDLTLPLLVTYDPATGARNSATPITGTGGVVITSLAYDQVTDTLYGNTAVSFGATNDQLFTIDTGTGAATPVGAMIGFNAVFALAFSNDGTLWGITNDDELITIDTTTGAGALEAPVTGGGGAYFDLAFRPEDNVAFVADSGTVGTGSLYTLDTSSGALTLVGGFGGPVNDVGLAFLVPEPGSLGLLGLGGAAILGRRRRRSRGGAEGRH